MNILIVLTSNDRLGASDRKTGLLLEELAAPYYAFKDAGADVTLVSPLGGQPPSIPRAMARIFRRKTPGVSAGIPRRRGASPAPSNYPTSPPATMMGGFSPAATASCGMWPKTLRPSS